MSDSGEDITAMLKTGDQLARDGMIPDAVRCYDRAGELFVASNQFLKAVAISKQIIALVDADHPELRPEFKHVWLQLADGYEHLGLLADAEQARNRHAEIT